MFDDDQFKVVAASKQLETLKVTFTDACKSFKGAKFSSLKSLSADTSLCNFLRKSHLPALESLRLTCCQITDSEIWEALSNCMIKHLDLSFTMPPSFSFNQACIVSLRLQLSYTEMERLRSSTSFANFSSLKALNVSNNCMTLNEVLHIVGQVNLEQLTCDLPWGCKRDNDEEVKSAIAKKVPHYWTTIEQYYKDIEANNDLKRYFTPYWPPDTN